MLLTHLSMLQKRHFGVFTILVLSIKTTLLFNDIMLENNLKVCLTLHILFMYIDGWRYCYQLHIELLLMK